MENNIDPHEDRSEKRWAERALTVAEKQLLSAAASGDTETVNGLLTNGEGNIDVNCRDALGRSAVELAVDAGHHETAEVLLQYGAKSGEALMYAVDKEDMATVQQLLKHSKNDGSPSVAFPSEMTPIVLASHKNSLPLIKVLTDQGQFIPDPAVLSHGDHASLNLYRGLASPYYILLTNDDPLRRAFVLSTRLDDLAAKTPEVEEVYAEIAEECRSLSVDLLDQVRNLDEAAAILNCGDEVSPLIHGDNCQMKLSRLNMAVDHEQKRFVAHQWSQRLVKESWYGPGKYFRPTTNMAEYLRGFVLMLLTPILTVVYFLAPSSRPGRFIRTPSVRFAMYLASVLTFIIIIMLRAEKVGYNGPEGGELAPEGTVLVQEWIIFVWILGMLLEEGRLMVKLGPLACLSAMGITTWLIIIIYLAAFFLRVASNIEHGGPQAIYRFYWTAYDTTLIAEALTAIGGVLAILRLLPLLTFDRFLGPLVLSMSHMVKDIVKFLIIFFIVSIAFSSGLNEIYRFYGSVVDNICFTQVKNATSPLKKTTCLTKNAFSNFESSFEELFWSLFGLGSKDTLNLEVNPKAWSPGDPRLEEHILTMYIGQALYGLYLVVAVVVLLNMLIAMMSNSYQQIADNETTEWRFEVTKLMLRYIRDDTTLPVPFNLIPTPKFIYNNVIKKCCLRGRYKRELDNKLQAKAENTRRYKEVLADLKKRYLLFHEREKGVEPIFADFTPHDPVTMATTTYL